MCENMPRRPVVVVCEKYKLLRVCARVYMHDIARRLYMFSLVLGAVKTLDVCGCVCAFVGVRVSVSTCAGARVCT